MVCRSNPNGYVRVGSSANCETVSETRLTCPAFRQNPVERLQLLAEQQSDVLLQKLGSSDASGGGGDTGVGAGLEGHDITRRSLPFGSEAPAASGSASSGILEPSYHGPGAAWEKDEAYLQQSTVMPPSEEERDVLET